MYINCWLCGNLYCIQRQRSRRPSSSSGSETCEAHCDSCHHHPHLLVVTFSSQSLFLSSVCTKMRFNAYFLLRGNQRSPSELGNQLTKNSQIAPTFLQHLRLCRIQFDKKCQGVKRQCFRFRAERIVDLFPVVASPSWCGRWWASLKALRSPCYKQAVASRW